MKKNIKKFLSLLLVFLMLFSVTACGSKDPGNDPNNPDIDNPVNPGKPDEEDERIEKRDENGDVCEDGWYYSAEDITEYIISFGKAPSNFYTKVQAKEKGWTSGSLEKIIPGAAFGGIEYSNSEKLLPAKSGRHYFYCDLNTHGKSDRGSERLVYSDDGLFYYSPDSFKTFTLFYGEPDEEPDKPDNPDNPSEKPGKDISVKKDGKYYDKDHVALYIHTYGKLPSNYVSKSKAKNAGWSGGSVEKYIEGAAIGGSQFSNNEGILPDKKGRQYYECDIDTKGEKTRGAKRIVYSNDGLIYYTDDHYETFTLLYGEE